MSDWFIKPPEFDLEFSITPGARIACMGSCFASELAQRAEQELFEVITDPTGVIFDALSLHDRFSRVVMGELTSADELFEHKGHFHSLSHHGSQSNEDKGKLVASLEQSDGPLREGLLSAELLLITFGTGSGYFLKGNGQVVANCHGLPNDLFDRKLLDLGRIKMEWVQTLADYIDLNEDVQIVLTVSPVRYTRYGLTENNRGKARLLMLAEYLTAHFDNVHYYPSYEMVLDELRDYRFYKQDRVHASEEAVDIIYSRFMDQVIPSGLKELYERIVKWKRFAQHRPIEGGEEHLRRVEETRAELKELIG